MNAKKESLIERSATRKIHGDRFREKAQLSRDSGDEDFARTMDLEARIRYLEAYYLISQIDDPDLYVQSCRRRLSAALATVPEQKHI